MDQDCGFVWDEESKLYFHASSGFYHDPNAGWYYSSKDGLYYKFENGSYVLIEQENDEEVELGQLKGVVSDELIAIEPCTMENLDDDKDENMRPPSEWLEETLIDLYLSGYSKLEKNVVDGPIMSTEQYAACNEDETNKDTYEYEEGEWIPEEFQDATETTNRLSNEGTSLDEENWLNQYGQVQSEEDGSVAFRFVDLWDWAMVTEMMKQKKHGKSKKREIARLVGRLVKPSAKLHPSMPSGGRNLKTTAICEVHLSLVRVSSGQVYRLKTPSLKYLSSISTYDASDPTKDWGFPQLSVEEPCPQSSKFPCGTPDEISASKKQLRKSEKPKIVVYKDRAAERRAFHGGFGEGPGQKNSADDVETTSFSTDEAAAEALNISFGVGSYARRMLNNMGWREGEALGSSTNGLVEPLKAVGNKGFAGVGWDQKRP